MPPVLLWIPSDSGGKKSEAWIATRHIVSLCCGTLKIQIELDTGRTIVLTYATKEDANTAIQCFQRAMTSPPTDIKRALYPKPIDVAVV